MDLTAWGRGERRGNTKKRIMKINLEIVIIAINKIISEEWGYGWLLCHFLFFFLFYVLLTFL